MSLPNRSGYETYIYTQVVVWQVETISCISLDKSRNFVDGTWCDLFSYVFGVYGVFGGVCLYLSNSNSQGHIEAVMIMKCQFHCRVEETGAPGGC